MTTFDVNEVRNFTASLNAQLDRCDHGEGTECITLDAKLMSYATRCREYREKVLQWGLEVFRGHVAFDAETDSIWRAEGKNLLARASDFLRCGDLALEDCCDLAGYRALGYVVQELQRLLDTWVTPARAVGPSARLGLALGSTEAQEVLKRIEGLPPMPTPGQTKS
jgi:hypothetical protein